MIIEVYTATQEQRDKYEGYTESDATATRTLRFAKAGIKYYISLGTPAFFPSIQSQLEDFPVEEIVIENEYD